MARILFRALSVVVSLLLFAQVGLARAKQNAGRTEERSGEVTSAMELPFRLLDGYLIVVEGRIGEQGHLKFALDTGATFSVLRTALARPEFARRTRQVMNLDRVLNEEVVDVSDFQLGPIRISSLPMMLNTFEYLGSDAPQVDAVIGLDVLRLRSFTIDFARKRILLGQARVLRFGVPLETNSSYISVEVRSNNEPLRLLLDTGVPSILLYRDRVSDRMPKVQVARTIAARSWGGVASLDLVTLPRVQLGQHDLDRRAVMSDKSPTDFLPGIDGYLSLMSLGARICGISWEEGTLSWE